ncbi:hypothetical protein BVRB_5g120150 [Beta vulgaris subsp. vulgaris]|nr:hypothetical protein BVRB_5g120150 [Beta vulgaris subsp. vulgaris]
MNTSFIESKISDFSFTLPHCKCMQHNNKVISFAPLMLLRSSSHKSLKVANTPKITCYRDTWLDLMAINHLSHNLQAVAGIEIEKDGYDGLLEACKVVILKFDPVQQSQLGLEGLKRSIPKQIFPLMKALIPPSKFTRELFAKFAGLFFAWLIGSSELKESEFNGKREKNVVHIKKCRFLEGSNCAGMCINLCKFPTQTFIKNSLGMPVTMVPNFEDMSCEMIFGVEPPPPDVDPATKQPCYKLCKMSRRHTIQSCS